MVKSVAELSCTGIKATALSAAAPAALASGVRPCRADPSRHGGKLRVVALGNQLGAIRAYELAYRAQRTFVGTSCNALNKSDVHSVCQSSLNRSHLVDRRGSETVDSAAARKIA